METDKIIERLLESNEKDKTRSERKFYALLVLYVITVVFGGIYFLNQDKSIVTFDAKSNVSSSVSQSNK